MMLYGSHLSVAGGLYNAVAEARRLRLQSLQIFTANQRQWLPKAPDEAAVEAFRSALQASRLGGVVSHASYLINLASPDPELRQKSIDAFAREIDRCVALGVPAAVVHPGAHLGTGEVEGIRRIAESLDRIYADRPDCGVRTLLETTAGQGTNIGHRFEHLRDIMGAAKCEPHLAICVDTCHIHAAGYDVVSPKGYEQTMEALHDSVGPSSVLCLHVNDSRGQRGSRIDRHAHIGHGTIGTAGFRRFVNDPRWSGIPAILETPKEEHESGQPWDRVNLRRLKRLKKR